MKYDYPRLYEKNVRFLDRHARLKKTVFLFNDYVPYLFLAAYGFLWVYGIFLTPVTPKDFAKIFFVPAFALLFVSILRSAIHRPRPYSEEGAGILPLREKKSVDNSFPSRHLTCAAVIAFTFFPYILWVGIALTVCTLVLAYCRFAIGWHYPSDLAAGIALGGTIGCLIFLL